jgi:hypothetical protein
MAKDAPNMPSSKGAPSNAPLLLLLLLAGAAATTLASVWALYSWRKKIGVYVKLFVCRVAVTTCAVRSSV